MNDPIEVSPFGNLLVFKKGYSPEFIERVISERKLDGLRIFDHLDRLESLDFLAEYGFIRKLDIDSLGDHNFEFLDHLTNLVSLGIGLSVKETKIIDLSRLTNLEELGLQWRKGKIKGLESCQKLKSLTLVDFKENDLMPIGALKNLRHLRVKTSTIKTLNGLGGLELLESILLGNCRGLVSIRAINGMKHLRSLEIELCTKIGDYDLLTDLPSLEYLRLTNCKEIKSIGFIRNFRSLQAISLLGNTNVLDGDLTPILTVKERHYAPKKHYNI